MKIQGPGKSDSVSKNKKTKKASESDGSFGDFMTEKARQSSSSGMTQSIAKVNALLAVQATEDPTERAAQRRMHGRAENILGELDKIRIALLGGNLTVGHMIDAADVVATHREKITDPALTAIMDEIDLRAQVELAKMRAALGR